jgi:hypothetical protein
LIGRDQIKSGRHHCLNRTPKEQRLAVLDGGTNRLDRSKDFAEVIMDSSIVINNQHAPVPLLRGFIHVGFPVSGKAVPG